MIIDRYRSDLNRLGIPPNHPEVLKVLPAVVVAWADGKMERLERLRILRLAHDHLGIGEQAREVLDGWLAKPPPAEVVAVGLAMLRNLAAAEDDHTIDPEELPDLVTCCEWVARSRAGALDAPWAVGPAEERAIRDMAEGLGVDAGRTWSSLLQELGETTAGWMDVRSDDPISAPISLRAPISTQEVRR